MALNRTTASGKVGVVATKALELGISKGLQWFLGSSIVVGGGMYAFLGPGFNKQQQIQWDAVHSASCSL
jgi:hypothetical protein